MDAYCQLNTIYAEAKRAENVPGNYSPVAVTHLVSRRASFRWGGQAWELHEIQRNPRKDHFYPWRVIGFNHYTGQEFAYCIPDIASRTYNTDTVMRGRELIEEARIPNRNHNYVTP